MQIHFATFTVHLLLVLAIHDPGQFNKYAHMVENQKLISELSFVGLPRRQIKLFLVPLIWFADF